MGAHGSPFSALVGWLLRLEFYSQYLLLLSTEPSRIGSPTKNWGSHDGFYGSKNYSTLRKVYEKVIGNDLVILGIGQKVRVGSLTKKSAVAFGISPNGKIPTDIIFRKKVQIFAYSGRDMEARFLNVAGNRLREMEITALQIRIRKFCWYVWNQSGFKIGSNFFGSLVENEVSANFLRDNLKKSSIMMSSLEEVVFYNDEKRKNWWRFFSSKVPERNKAVLRHRVKP